MAKKSRICAGGEVHHLFERRWERLSPRRRTDAALGLAVLVVLAALVLLAALLHGEQSGARRSLISRFEDGARVTSALTQAVLSSTSGSAAQAVREYGSRTVSGRLLGRAGEQGEVAYAALLDSAGQVIEASHDLSSSERADLLASPALRPVLAGAPVSVSDVLPAGNRSAGRHRSGDTTEHGGRSAGTRGRDTDARVGHFPKQLPSPGPRSGRSVVRARQQGQGGRDE